METDSVSALNWLPTLLQCADPLFPTGSYAHSFGLEELVQLGVVHDENSLADFLSRQLLPGMEKLELPYLRFGLTCTLDVATLSELDREIHAWKLASEARLASIQIGNRRLAALHKNWPSELTSEFLRRLRAGHTFGHHLIAYALQSRLQHIPLEAALLGYGYQGLAGACTAALKLIRIGQDGCQRVLTLALKELPNVVARSLTIQRNEAGYFSPLLEIATMRHALAEERLFMS
jgi:urease accessory protein